jgi:hypothetical protein
MPLVSGHLIKGNICVSFKTICCIHPILIRLVAEDPGIPYILSILVIVKELFEYELLMMGL